MTDLPKIAPDAVKDLPSDDYKGAIGKDGIAIFGPTPDWEGPDILPNLTRKPSIL